jgi:cold shock CspA family protein
MVDIKQLPREITPISKEIPPVTEPNRGRVLFFNASTGLGLAKIADNKIAGIHWRKIQTEEPFPYLETGDEVTFRHSYTENGYIKIAGVELV